MTLAAQATKSATVSVRLIRSQKVCSVVPMPTIFRRFYLGSPEDSFFGIQDSLRTQGLPPWGAKTADFVLTWL
jgi:hypothetical protein